MKNWQKQMAIAAFFSTFWFSGCAPARLSEAVIFEKTAGRPDQKGATEVAFLLKLRKPATLAQTLEVEGARDKTFKIISITDEKNVMKNVEKELPKGIFRIRATSVDSKLAQQPNLVLQLKIGEKTVLVRPKSGKAVLAK